MGLADDLRAELTARPAKPADDRYFHAGEPVEVILQFHPYTVCPGILKTYGARRSVVELPGGRLKEVPWDRLRRPTLDKPAAPCDPRNLDLLPPDLNATPRAERGTPARRPARGKTDGTHARKAG